MSLLKTAKDGYNSLIGLPKDIMDFLATKPVKDKCYEKLKELSNKLPVSTNALLPLLQQGNPGSYSTLQEEIEELNATILKLEKEKEVLSRTNENLSNCSPITDKIEEVMNKWKQDLDNETLNTSLKKEVKDTVKENLKDVMKDAFDGIVSTDKMKKTFAEVVKNSQNVIQKETEKCFNKSLTSALQESQQEIVAKTSARQEADLFDRERRTRNVVITYVEESTLPDTEQRKDSDKIMVTELLQMDGNNIENCYRVGSPIGSGSNKDSDRKGPRPLVIVLKTPELAKSLHKYGNGCKLSHEGQEYWVNPDLTKAERRANYMARQKRRERRIMKTLDTDSDWSPEFIEPLVI